MKRRDDPEVAAWLRKVRGDLRMAKLAIADSMPLWDQGCFHSQQAAEKALKALLVACDLAVPRTHDLVALVELLGPSVPAAGELAEDAAVLEHFGVAPRYPTLASPETEADARDALVRAKRIVAMVRKALRDAGQQRLDLPVR